MKKDKTIMVFGINEEFEGDSVLYFDLSKPKVIIDYFKNNIEKGDVKKVFIDEMKLSDFEELE